MTCYLALDQSTSATKALLFDEAGRLLGKRSVDHRQIHPQPGWHEHDPAEIWDNTRVVLRDLLAAHADLVPHIVSLSLANQRETFVVFDSATGHPLHNAIVWQCRRAAALCTRWIELGLNDWVHSRTGLPIDTYFSGPKLAHLLHERPDLRRSLTSGAARIGTIDTYLIHRLTCGQTFATDLTNACRTLLLSLDSLRWDPDLCAHFSVPVTALPELRPSHAAFGSTTLDGLLPRPIPIRGVMGDSQASLLAHGCLEPGSAKVTLGSGSSLLLNAGSAPERPTPPEVCTLAWQIDGRATFAFEGLINTTGATLPWLRDQLGLIDSLDDAESLARSVPDSGGVFLVPAFAGLGCPHWEPDARAAILGLTSHSAKPHIVRAALEAIAYQIDDALSAMQRSAPEPIRRLHCDGGGVRNRFLLQFCADLCRCDLVASSCPDLSPLGAVFMAMLGSGAVSEPSQLPFHATDPTLFRPALPSEAALQLRASWRAAVRRVLAPAAPSLPG